MTNPPVGQAVATGRVAQHRRGGVMRFVVPLAGTTCHRRHMRAASGLAVVPHVAEHNLGLDKAADVDLSDVVDPRRPGAHDLLTRGQVALLDQVTDRVSLAPGAGHRLLEIVDAEDEAPGAFPVAVEVLQELRRRRIPRPEWRDELEARVERHVAVTIGAGDRRAVHVLELDAEQLLGLLDVPGDVLGPDYPDEVIDPVHIPAAHPRHYTRDSIFDTMTCRRARDERAIRPRVGMRPEAISTYRSD